MDSAEQLKAILIEIDETMDTYCPPRLASDRIVGDILGEQRGQRYIFDKVVSLATEALQTFQLHPALLVRRALARRMIINDGMEYPEAEAAETDLRTALKVDPDNLEVGFELLNLLHTFSGMDDSSVAGSASELAIVASRYLCNFRALQIRALGYADRFQEADELYEYWSAIFPESQALKAAMKTIESLRRDKGSEH